MRCEALVAAMALKRPDWLCALVVGSGLRADSLISVPALVSTSPHGWFAIRDCAKPVWFAYAQAAVRGAQGSVLAE